MDNFLDSLNNNPWLNLVFLILAMLGIVLSLYLFIRGRKNKVPTYLIKTFNLIKNRVTDISEVEIKYSGNKIENLSLTKCAIWNRGDDVIDVSDVASKSPIRLEIDEDYEFLHANITFMKNEINNFSLNISDDRKTIYVRFDYFQKNEGLTFEVYHTATKGNKIKLKGILKGAPKFKNAKVEKDFLVDYVFEHTVFKLEDKLNLKGTSLKVFNVLTFPLLFIMAVILLPIQGIIQVFRRNPIPEVYNLTDEK